MRKQCDSWLIFTKNVTKAHRPPRASISVERSRPVERFSTTALDDDADDDHADVRRATRVRRVEDVVRTRAE